MKNSAIKWCAWAMLVCGFAVEAQAQVFPQSCLQFSISACDGGQWYQADRYVINCSEIPESVQRFRPCDIPCPVMCGDGFADQPPIRIKTDTFRGIDPLEKGQDFKDKMPKTLAVWGQKDKDETWDPREGMHSLLSKVVYVSTKDGNKVPVKLFAIEMDYRKIKKLPTTKWKTPVRTMRLGYEALPAAVEGEAIAPTPLKPKKNKEAPDNPFVGMIYLEGGVFFVQTKTAMAFSD